MRSDGYLVITGRIKDIIIRKGENISAFEVEQIVESHPNVRAAAAIGIPDRERGERVCAVVELIDATQPMTLQDLVDHCTGVGAHEAEDPRAARGVGQAAEAGGAQVAKDELRAAIEVIPWP